MRRSGQGASLKSDPILSIHRPGWLICGQGEGRGDEEPASRQKGYSAVVKTLKHQVLGKVFVIQLQPVNSVSRATTLMTQLSGEIEGEPVIIKVPAR